MGTHGSILVKDGDTEMFLNTPHDGHLDEAIEMLLTLPEYIATKHPYLDMVVDSYALKGSPPTQADIKKHLQRSLPFEWVLTTIVGAITSRHWNRWLVIPSTWIKSLADYDQTPDLVLDVSDPGEVKITISEEHRNSEMLLESETLRTNAKGVATIEVSYPELYEAALFRRAMEMYYEQKAKYDN